MRISVPSDLDITMSEPSCYLLYVYTFVDKQRCVCVPEIVYSYVRQVCFVGILNVFVCYSAISDAINSTTDTKIFCEFL